MRKMTELQADLRRVGYQLGGAHLTQQARRATFNTFAKTMGALEFGIRTAKQIGAHPGGGCSTSSLQNPAQGGTLRLDIERYRHHLDGMNLSEAQAAEMLNALWSLLSAFVDLGFGVDSVHLALPQSKEGALETDATAEKFISAQQPGIHAVKEPRS